MWDGVWTRLRGLLRRETLEREMTEELEQHLERTTELLIRRGLRPDEARITARREFGNVGVVMEEARDAHGVRWLDDLRRDVRHGGRALARSPGFTAVVVVTLALGFGANGALFSMLKGALNPSLVQEPSTWVRIPVQWSYAGFVLLHDSSRTLTQATATADASVVLAGQTPEQDPEEIRAQFVSGDFFPGLRGRPALGRVFTADEAAPPVGADVAVLSYRFWERRFARDTAMIGRTIRVSEGHPLTVIGVMPREFVGLDIHTPDVWLPLGLRQRLPGDVNQSTGVGDGSWFGAAGREWLWVSARLAPGASLEGARAELALRAAQFAPAGDDSARARIVMTHLRTADSPGVSGSEVQATGLVLGAALSVLLIASATVANLMLARAAARRREMGIRLSLGASRARVVREWMTECLLLSLAGAALGLILSWIVVRSLALSDAFAAVIEDMDPVLFARIFTPDVGVVAYMAALAVVSALIFGLAPALRATRTDPLTSIRVGADGTGLRLERVPLRSGLVVSQVALTMVLLLVSGMLLRGLTHASRLDPGFERHDVMAVSSSLQVFGNDSARARRFADEFAARAGSVPGVRLVTRGNIPIENWASALVTSPSEPPLSPEVRWNGSFNAVSETFFDALGIEIVRGRAFTQAEVRQEAPVAIVSEATARLLWPDAEAIGQIITVRPAVRGVAGRPREGLFDAARVVGVARDAQMLRLGSVPRRYVYVPGDYWSILLRRSPGEVELVARLRALARDIDPHVVLRTRTLEQIIWRSTGWLSTARLTSLFAATLGGLSLVMAVVGLFGLTAYAVEQRTREFGVRMALGAQSGNVVRLVTGQALRLVGIGAALGVAGGIAGSGVLRSLLFGVQRVDPTVYAAVILLLATVTTLACVVPARKATRVDPVVALRAD